MKMKFRCLYFEDCGIDDDGTHVYQCFNTKQGEFLGGVEFHEEWNQYVFWAASEDMVFGAECLEDIAKFLKQINPPAKEEVKS